MMWLNGELVENGAIDASSAGLTLGWGVFRTLGVVAGAPRFFARHFERLREDAAAAQLDFSFSSAVVFEALQRVLRAHSVENGLARLTLTQRGDGRWNSQDGVDFSILAVQQSPVSTSARVITSRYCVEAKRPLAGVKTTSYLPSLWAWREAKQAGFDEAILCVGAGFLSEGARSTLIWAKNGEIWTPSLECGCLRGVGRDLVLEWAAANEIRCRQGRFQPENALEADEMWLVSAASGARFVAAWHDENGVLRRDFSQHSLGEQFQKWWSLAAD
ncbi:MAG TPA: aminotransferase class IV [Abditibacterium sp.]|jgi:branched-subunit amino acid aminotransferase/4-amino-4-deoxychorismate lyase